jgi:hypothetical protein
MMLSDNEPGFFFSHRFQPRTLAQKYFHQQYPIFGLSIYSDHINRILIGTAPAPITPG